MDILQEAILTHAAFIEAILTNLRNKNMNKTEAVECFKQAGAQANNLVLLSKKL